MFDINFMFLKEYQIQHCFISGHIIYVQYK